MRSYFRRIVAAPEAQGSVHGLGVAWLVNDSLSRAVEKGVAAVTGGLSLSPVISCTKCD